MGALLIFNSQTTIDYYLIPLIVVINCTCEMHQLEWLLKLERKGCSILILQLLISDMLWLYSEDPVVRLKWDEGGWFWSHSLGKHKIKVLFFQYLVKLERSLLQLNFAFENILERIWSFKGPTKFILFIALLVGHSLKGNVMPNLQQCGFFPRISRDYQACPPVLSRSSTSMESTSVTYFHRDQCYILA